MAYTGGQADEEEEEEEEDFRNGLKAGELVFCWAEEEEQEEETVKEQGQFHYGLPLSLGRVTRVGEDTVEVAWMRYVEDEPGYHGLWTPWIMKGKQAKNAPYKSVMPKEAICNVKVKVKGKVTGMFTLETETMSELMLCDQGARLSSYQVNVCNIYKNSRVGS